MSLTQWFKALFRRKADPVARIDREDLQRGSDWGGLDEKPSTRIARPLPEWLQFSDYEKERMLQQVERIVGPTLMRTDDALMYVARACHRRYSGRLEGFYHWFVWAESEGLALYYVDMLHKWSRIPQTIVKPHVAPRVERPWPDRVPPAPASFYPPATQRRTQDDETAMLSAAIQMASTYGFSAPEPAPAPSFKSDGGGDFGGGGASGSWGDSSSCSSYDSGSSSSDSGSCSSD